LLAGGAIGVLQCTLESNPLHRSDENLTYLIILSALANCSLMCGPQIPTADDKAPLHDAGSKGPTFHREIALADDTLELVRARASVLRSEQRHHVNAWNAAERFNEPRQIGLVDSLEPLVLTIMAYHGSGRANVLTIDAEISYPVEVRTQDSAISAVHLITKD
jgi:hypothetical protein